ncbi:MAG: hypothetical protein NT062_39240 [Proteobacteria bacterium]|nr:hypothetical protein [Pseudomonadota bacterium]
MTIPARCRRCNSDEVTGSGWCGTCESAYDTWNRRHASDIIVSVLGGTVVVAFAGIGLPLLGLGWVIAATGALSAAATIVGISRVLRRRRRRQFLDTSLPKAYLPSGR